RGDDEAPSAAERNRTDAGEVERGERAAPTPRPAHLRLPEESPVDELADHVSDEDVRLLDARGEPAGRDAQAHVDDARELAAVAAGEPDRLDADFATDGDRAQDARRAAAGRDRERDVAGGAERAHLAGEDVVVAVVVGDR